jgi:outer membrane protein assembly factor BamB
VEAWSLSDGQSLWRNERLTYRRLSHPVLLDQGVVVGDAEGYLQVLSRDDGRVVGRVEACSSAVVALRGQADRVVALCADGTLAAYALH